MRTNHAARAPIARPRIAGPKITRPRRLSPPVTFICSGCECVEHRSTPALPKGWTTRQVCNDLFAYCPDCSDGEDPAVVAARLRRETVAFAAMAPVLLAVFSACWAMLPA